MLGKFLLAFAAIVAVLSPLTEMTGHFDNFPHGGDDFELSCFTLIVLLCLVLLAALWGKKVVDDLLREPGWEPLEFGALTVLLVSRFLSGNIAWVPPKQPVALGVFALPLRI